MKPQKRVDKFFRLMKNKVIHIKALKGVGSAPKRLSRTRELSRMTDVEWLFPEPCGDKDIVHKYTMAVSA